MELIARLAGTGVEPDVRGTGNPEGEIDRQYVDSAKIRELVGWQPEVDLEEGLRRTIDWYRAHPEARAPALAESARAPVDPRLAGQAAVGHSAIRA